MSAVLFRASLGRARSWLGVAVLVSASPAAPAAEPAFPPGHYLLTAQLVMPHLEEMRRMSTHGEQCLSGATPEALFPVLRQPALRGCRFTDGKRAGTRNEYVFACASATRRKRSYGPDARSGARPRDGPARGQDGWQEHDVLAARGRTA